jgi:hypothetical protein
MAYQPPLETPRSLGPPPWRMRLKTALRSPTTWFILGLLAWCSYLTYEVKNPPRSSDLTINIETVQKGLADVKLQVDATGSSMWTAYNGVPVLAYLQIIGYENSIGYIPVNATSTSLPDVFNTTAWSNISVYAFAQDQVFCCDSPTFFLSTDYAYICYYHAAAPTSYDITCVTVSAACRYISQWTYIVNQYSPSIQTGSSFAALYLSYGAETCPS